MISFTFESAEWMSFWFPAALSVWAGRFFGVSVQEAETPLVLRENRLYPLSGKAGL
jgi:hypothetical protein